MTKIQNSKPKMDFLFVDEVGISLDPNQPYFGVGGFKVSNTIKLNRKLHQVFTGAVSFLQQKEDRFEFKFTYITHRSLRFYKEIINILDKDNNWQFQYILKKKEATWAKETFWQEYLEQLAGLMELFKGQEGLILVADYLSKPKNQKRDLFEIAGQNPLILNILQLESQGSLLLQVADILLGGVTYQKRIENDFKTDDLKEEISNLVVQLLNEKEQL